MEKLFKFYFDLFDKNDHCLNLNHSYFLSQNQATHHQFLLDYFDSYFGRINLTMITNYFECWNPFIFLIFEFDQKIKMQKKLYLLKHFISYHLLSQFTNYNLFNFGYQKYYHSQTNIFFYLFCLNFCHINPNDKIQKLNH